MGNKQEPKERARERVNAQMDDDARRMEMKMLSRMIKDNEDGRWKDEKRMGRMERREKEGEKEGEQGWKEQTGLESTTFLEYPLA